MNAKLLEAKFFEIFQETAVRSVLKTTVPKYDESCHGPLVRAFVNHPSVQRLAEIEDATDKRVYDWKQVGLALLHSLLASCGQALRAPSTVNATGLLVAVAKEYNYEISIEHQYAITHRGSDEAKRNSPEAKRLVKLAKQNRM